MSIDIFYQPISLDLIPRILRYARGEDDLEDVLDKAMVLAKTRVREEQWRLAIQRLYVNSPGLFPNWFDADISILERPFFIVAEDSEEVVRAVDRYIDGGADAVDGIIRSMIEKVESSLIPRIEPEERSMPSDNELRTRVMKNVTIIREACDALSGARPFRHAEYGPWDPRELLETEFVSVALEFGRHCYPYWSNPGYGSSILMAESELAMSQFDPPAKLFEPVLTELPEVGKYLGPTEGCEMMGGVLTPDKVAAVRREAETICRTQPSRSTIGQDRRQSGFRTLCEALAYAERHRLAYTEAIT